MAERAAQELGDARYVNLGIGIPTLVANYLRGRDVMIHSENGIMGVGPSAELGREDPDLINAGKEPVTTAAGASFFDSALSFAMIRGGHLDLAVLGAMQVSSNGDIANWSDGSGIVKGIGGAMDLCTGARRIISVMTHRTPAGTLKLVRRCTLPLTAANVVSTLVTDIGVFDIEDGSFLAREAAEGEYPFAPDVSELVDCRNLLAALTGAGVR
jgi:3-oxoacid CoA-transferase subunit B